MTTFWKYWTPSIKIVGYAALAYSLYLYGTGEGQPYHMLWVAYMMMFITKDNKF